MEQISHSLSKIVGQNSPAKVTSANPRFESALPHEIENYQNRLYLIVADSFHLSSQTPTDEEKAMRCESWARHLMGFVPETELQRSFDRAFADHESNFPVSAYEIKTAWQRIVESEQSVVRQDNLSAIDNPIDCVRCDGSGVEMIYNSTGECLGARPGCDHKPVSEGEGIALYLQHQAELIADTKAKVALDASFREAIRICSRLITELIQAEAETEDDSEREQIVAGKGQLLRVRRYLQASI